MMILFMDLEMFREIIDPLRQYRYLNIGRTGITVMSLELTDYLFFLVNA